MSAPMFEIVRLNFSRTSAFGLSNQACNDLLPESMTALNGVIFLKIFIMTHCSDLGLVSLSITINLWFTTFGLLLLYTADL